MIPGARFIRCRVENLINQVVVEGGGHADGLGKYGDAVVVGKPVQGFTPPVEIFDTQSRDSFGNIAHQGGLFFQSQPFQQIVRSLFRTCTRIQKRQGLPHESCGQA